MLASTSSWIYRPWNWVWKCPFPRTGFAPRNRLWKRYTKEVACIVSKPLVSCLWWCGESVNPQNLNIHGKGRPKPATHFPGFFTFIKSHIYCLTRFGVWSRGCHPHPPASASAPSLLENNENITVVISIVPLQIWHYTIYINTIVLILRESYFDERAAYLFVLIHTLLKLKC